MLGNFKSLNCFPRKVENISKVVIFENIGMLQVGRDQVSTGVSVPTPVYGNLS